MRGPKLIKRNQQRNILNRRQTFAALGATLVMPYVQPSWAFASRIRISNRADNIGETTLEDFEARTGIGVQYQVVEDMDPPGASEDLSKSPVLRSDVAILPHTYAALAAHQGLLAPLEHDLLPGWGALDPHVGRIAFGSAGTGAEYGMPYLWGSYNPERSEFWVDVAVIPRSTSMGEHAHQFLRFLLEPKVIADCTNYTARANANLDASDLVRPELRSDPRIYPQV